MRQSHLQPVPDSIAGAPETRPEGDPHLIPVQLLRQLAHRQATEWLPKGPHSGSDSNIQTRGKEAKQILSACLKPPAEVTPDWQWLHENRRLLRTAQVESKGALKLSRKHPHVALEQMGMVPRAYAVAFAFLDAAQDEFTEPALQVYLTALQEVCKLEMGEIWALKPMLQLILLEKVAASALAKAAPALAKQITSLREVGQAQWKDLFEAVNAVDGVLEKDPAQAYHRMDYDSRDLYRKVIAKLAAKSSISEMEMA